jgi:hypothetical protein
VVGAQKVQGDRWLVFQYPTVVGLCRDVKELPGSQLHDAAVGEGGGSLPF